MSTANHLFTMETMTRPHRRWVTPTLCMPTGNHFLSGWEEAAYRTDCTSNKIAIIWMKMTLTTLVHICYWYVIDKMFILSPYENKTILIISSVIFPRDLDDIHTRFELSDTGHSYIPSMKLKKTPFINWIVFHIWPILSYCNEKNAWLCMRACVRACVCEWYRQCVCPRKQKPLQGYLGPHISGFVSIRANIYVYDTLI